MQLSAVGVRLSFHYCGDTLKEVSILEPAESCCGVKEIPNSFPSEDNCIKKGSCCSLEYQVIDGTDAPLTTTQVKAFHPISVEFIQPIVYSFSSITETQIAHPDANAPPLSGRDILVRVQRFLI